MDVITPDLYWIDNRCYRRNPSRRAPLPIISSSGSSDVRSSSSSGSTAVLKPYVEEDEFGCDPDVPDELLDDNFVIERDHGGFKTVCDVPSQLYAVVIGQRGQTKGRIERETRTRIYVPRQGEKGQIVVSGQKEKDVRTSRRTIELLASQARGKRDLTHFPCFPLNDAGIVTKFNEFKDLILKECGLFSNGVDKDLFVEPEKVHLTLCMVTLFDEGEREKAASMLEDVVKEEVHGKLGIQKGTKVTVRIKDLEIMNDDPTEVDVLYAKVHEVGGSGILQKISDAIAEKFSTSGFGKRNRGESVKLHCTLMNSRKKAERLQETQGQGQGRGGYSRRESFDASLILSKFSNFDFGQIDISTVKLATRFTTGPDGFYKAYRSVSL